MIQHQTPCPNSKLSFCWTNTPRNEILVEFVRETSAVKSAGVHFIDDYFVHKLFFYHMHLAKYVKNIAQILNISA